MSSAQVWQALAYAGNEASAALDDLKRAEEEVARLERLLVVAREAVATRTASVAATRAAAREALNAAQADLAKNGVAGPTKH